jgi:hypothetical protein
MESKYIVGTPETARFDFTRGNLTLDKTAKRINLASEYLWEHGQGDHGTDELPILFTSLTKAKKLKLVSDHLQNVIDDMAKTQLSIRSQEAARQAAELDAETNY